MYSKHGGFSYKEWGAYKISRRASSGPQKLSGCCPEEKLFQISRISRKPGPQAEATRQAIAKKEPTSV